jgi:hypothetical protein
VYWIDVIGVNSYIQQDPQEFQNLFFSKLEQISSSITSSSNSSISSSSSISDSSSAVSRSFSPVSVKGMFVGKEKHSIKCLQCYQERSSLHDFNELCLTIDNDISLEKAIEIFHLPELLENENKCFCEKCHQTTTSERKIEIMKFPSILCIHLLRYKYNRLTNNKVKTRFKVKYPLTLKLRDGSNVNNNDGKEGFIETDEKADKEREISRQRNARNGKKDDITDMNGTKEHQQQSLHRPLINYTLVSVIFHLGKSAHGGHYVCDIYDWNRHQWIHCDDEMITEVSQDIVLMNNIHNNDDEVLLEGEEKGKESVSSLTDLTGESEEKEKKMIGRKSASASATVVPSSSVPSNSDNKRRKVSTSAAVSAAAASYFNDEELESKMEPMDDVSSTGAVEEEDLASSKKRKRQAPAAGTSSFQNKNRMSSKVPISVDNASEEGDAPNHKHVPVVVDGSDEDVNQQAAESVNDSEAEDIRKKPVEGKKTPGKKTATKGKKADLTGDKKKEEKSSSSSSSSSTNSSSFVSHFQRQRDVYLLYYIRDDCLESSITLKREILGNKDIIEEVRKQSERFEKEVESFLEKKKEIEEQINQRKVLYESISTSLIPLKTDKTFHLLPANWLKKWIIGDETTFPSWKQRLQQQQQQLKAASPPLIMDISSDTASDILLTEGLVTVKTVPMDDNMKIVEEDDDDNNDDEANRTSDDTTPSLAEEKMDNRFTHDLENQEEPTKKTEDNDDEVIVVDEKKPKTSLIGNKEKLCIHGYLNINYIDDMKIISEKAFQTIFSSSSSSSPGSSSSSSSPRTSFFLQENLDYDLTQDNFRCSVCYDSIVIKRQQVLNELKILNEMMIKYAAITSKTIINSPYYLSKQDLQLLRRYLLRLDKHQSSKKLEGNKNEEEEDVETKEGGGGVGKEKEGNGEIKASVISLLEDGDDEVTNETHRSKKAKKKEGSSGGKMDSFLVSKSPLNGINEEDKDEENDQSKEEDMKKKKIKNELEFIRNDIFKNGSSSDIIINENLLCEKHHQPSLTLEKRSVLVTLDIWELILKLFPQSITLTKNHTILCSLCNEEKETLFKENQEKKNLKANEIENEELVELWKRPNKKKASTSSSSSSSKPAGNEKVSSLSIVIESKGKGRNKEKEIQQLHSFVTAFNDDETPAAISTSAVTTKTTSIVTYPPQWQEAVSGDITESSFPEFYLLEKSWLDMWRTYMNSHSLSSTAATTTAIKTPSLLSNHSLQCKHGQLLVNLPSLKQFCPTVDFDFLLHEELMKSAKTEEELTQEFVVPQSIDSLPTAELLTKEQWNRLKYFHYLYPLEQVELKRKQQQSTSPSKRNQDLGIIIDEDQVDMEVDVQEMEAYSASNEKSEGNPEINKIEKSNKNELFEVKLEAFPSDHSSSSGSVTTVSSKVDWAFTPSPCLPCLLDAVQQYNLNQRYYEHTNLLVYLIKDPILLLSLLDVLKENEKSKSCISLSEGEIDSLFQTLVTKEDNADVAGGGEGGAVGEGGGGGRRRSTRQTTNSLKRKYKKVFLTVSSQDVITLLKLKIYESHDLPFSSQQVFLGKTGKELVQGSMKLVDYGVEAKDFLIVFDKRSGGGETTDGGDGGDDFDFAFHEIAENSGHGSNSGKKKETGFHGSIFSSSASKTSSAGENGASSTAGKEDLTTPIKTSKKSEVIELLNDDSQQSPFAGTNVEVQRQLLSQYEKTSTPTAHSAAVSTTITPSSSSLFAAVTAAKSPFKRKNEESYYSVSDEDLLDDGEKDNQEEDEDYDINDDEEKQSRKKKKQQVGRGTASAGGGGGRGRGAGGRGKAGRGSGRKKVIKNDDDSTDDMEEVMKSGRKVKAETLKPVVTSSNRGRGRNTGTLTSKPAVTATKKSSAAPQETYFSDGDDIDDGEEMDEELKNALEESKKLEYL